MTRSPLPAALAGLLLLTGCASSERMTRMSGGIIGEYSAPRAHRLRSQRFQAQTRTYATGRAPEAADLNLNTPLVNLWPFFFRSNAYFAILWPLIDYDPYGVAFRPFYNQEGDDRSILFPLSSWNSETGRGWVLNTWWNPDYFFCFPFAYHSWNPRNGCFWYTPLWIHAWSQPEHPNWWSPRRKSSFRELLLFYHTRRVQADPGPWSWLKRFNFADPGAPNELRYRLTPLGEPVPESAKQFEEYRQRVFAALPDRELRSTGFFPLFHYEQEPDRWSLRLLLFNSILHQPDQRSYSLFGPLLARYRQTEPEPNFEHHDRGGWDFLSLPLLSYFEKTEVFRLTSELKTFRELVRLSRERNFNPRADEVRTALARIAPGVPLPSTVVDGNTFRLFLHELAAARVFPTESHYQGGCLPLFLYEHTPETDLWILPPLLTGWYLRPGSSGFYSLPLLTAVWRTPAEQRSMVGTPLLWYARTVTAPDRTTRPILPRDTEWTTVANQYFYQDTYALCGLYYRGDDRFLVEKAGVKPGLAETVRKGLWQLSQRWTAMTREQRNLAERSTRNAAKKITSKIDRYYQLIEEERIREATEKLERQRREWHAELAKLNADSAPLGLELSEQTFATPGAPGVALNRWLELTAEPRSHRDFGFGYGFRREEFDDGDYHWRLFGGLLASGEKQGPRESTQVLQLLYRHRREGNRSETLFFPFVAIQREEDAFRFSFLWRVFELTGNQDRIGGHILFIPFGSDD